MATSDRLFIAGNPNPDEFGQPLRSCAGDAPNPMSIVKAAELLGRSPYYVDASGYECEIIAAAIRPSSAVAYVESRAKGAGFNRDGLAGRQIDVSIKIHFDDLAGGHQAVDIESYNPFFGCDVRFLKWYGRSALLIYCEKHWTFACEVGLVWPPTFFKIEERWAITASAAVTTLWAVLGTGRPWQRLPFAVTLAASGGLLPAYYFSATRAGHFLLAAVAALISLITAASLAVVRHAGYRLVRRPSSAGS